MLTDAYCFGTGFVCSHTRARAFLLDEMNGKAWCPSK